VCSRFLCILNSAEIKICHLRIKYLTFWTSDFQKCIYNRTVFSGWNHCLVQRESCVQAVYPPEHEHHIIKLYKQCNMNQMLQLSQQHSCFVFRGPLRIWAQRRTILADAVYYLSWSLQDDPRIISQILPWPLWTPQYLVGYIVNVTADYVLCHILSCKKKG
jgi:hypothetical protein